MRFESSGLTGGLAEEELVGKSRYERVSRLDSSSFQYIPRSKAMDMLRDMQPFDPSEPTPDFANTVHYYVFDGLGLNSDEVRFYTAVKSPLDVFHGVDAWFESDNGGKKKIVTIDVTMNPNKDTGYKADIVFLVPRGGLDRKVDKGQFMEYSRKLADEVIEFFKEGSHE